ncbi:MAG: substrate-binding domain-containing protein [Acidobacteriota bacterium]
MKLRILSGGAAQGIVTALAGKLKTETGYDIDGTFSAVGAMKEKLLGGAPCDLIILSAKLIGELAEGGHLVPGTVTDLGVVFTGVAVKKGGPLPIIDDAPAFKGSLLDARGIYFPDPERATAGIHFMQTLDRLGIRTIVASQLRPYPNGATAMREMAKAAEEKLIGVTQITEINNTPGLTLVGRLPREFELATTYTLAVNAKAESPEAARRFAEILSSKDAGPLRKAAGFES